MSTRLPPRYLPTLTEVVDQVTLANASITPVPMAAPAKDAAPADTVANGSAFKGGSAAPLAAAPDRHLLAQQLIQLVRPQLENELRALAQELFEAQFSALLPSLHLHIEEAVREAIELALPESPDT